LIIEETIKSSLPLKILKRKVENSPSKILKKMENLNRRNKIPKILKIANLLIRKSQINKEIKRRKTNQQKMPKI
jgi:hypothetical protein